MKEEEIEKPVGEFLLNNADFHPTFEGAYFHYSDVCNVMKLYADQVKQQAVIEALEKEVPKAFGEGSDLLSEFNRVNGAIAYFETQVKPKYEPNKYKG